MLDNLQGRTFVMLDPVVVDEAQESAVLALGVPHLFYLLKGSHLDPAWDLEVLLGAVGALGAGKHLISFWGLAMGRWSRPSFARRPQAA